MKHYRIIRDNWGAVERLTGAALIIAAIVLTLLALSTCAAEAAPGQAPASDGDLPYRVTTTGTLSGVNCYGPTCCGQVSTIINHVRYETFREYCRWWPKTIRNGQTVRATMYRTDLNIW